MDWTDIEAQLQDRAEEVCRYLLPNGKRLGHEWQVGSAAGEAGDSLRINLAGKVGVWSDFAGGEVDGKQGGKTLMSLWCSVRHKEFKECIREAKQFLGIRDDYGSRVRRAPTPGPTSSAAPVREQPEESSYQAVAQIWAKCHPLTRGGPVWKYLTGSRGVAEEAIEWYDIREMASHNRWVIVFPYFPSSQEQQLVDVGQSNVPAWLKFEQLDRPQGKKREWTSRGPEKSLFGVQLVAHPAFKKVQHLLICEGEKDALSWASYCCGQWGNILPVSVPFGAKWRGQDKTRPSPNREWIDRDWEWMQRFETVFVAMDSDEAGQRAAADIITEIGPRRCRLVQLPEVST